MNAHSANEGLTDVGGTTDMTETMKSKAQTLVSDMRRGLNEGWDTAKQRMSGAQHATESYVRGNPWKSIGISLLLGYFVGMLARPR